MLKEQGFLQQSSSPLETKPCTVVFKNGRKLAIVGLLQLLVSLVVIGFGIGSAFLWEDSLKKSCINYDWQARNTYRVQTDIEIHFHYNTENNEKTTESPTTESQTSLTTANTNGQNELILFLVVQKFILDFSKLDPYDKLQDIENLLKDRIPALNNPEWIKYLKPYILAKLDDTKNELENDPAVVILEDSDEVISVDISGEGSQGIEAGSGEVSKRQLRNQAYVIKDQDKVDKISKIVSRAVDDEEDLSEEGSGFNEGETIYCDFYYGRRKCRKECPIICEARYNVDEEKFAVFAVVLAASLLSIPVIAGLFGLISGCMLKKRHTKNLSVLQPPLSKSASVSYIVVSALAALSDCALNVFVSIFLYQTLFVLTMEIVDVPKFVMVIALWIFLIIAFILNFSLVIYGMMCPCCFNSVALVQGCTADGNDQKRAKSTFSMSFSNKVKYTTSGAQRLDLDIQFGQGSISLRSTTVWNRQSTSYEGEAAFGAPRTSMDATAISTLRINTNLSEMRDQRFCKNVMSFHSCPPYMQESNPVFTDWSIFQNKETLPAPEDEEIMLGHNYTPKSRLEEIPPFPLDESIKEPEEQSHVNNYDQIQKL